MTDPTGNFSALLTPFDGNGAINHAATERLVAFQQGLGVQGLHVGGSSGEAMLQGKQERIEYLGLVARIDGGGMPLIAQVGAIATADTVALAKRTAAAGYQAVSAIAPTTAASPAAR